MHTRLHFILYFASALLILSSCGASKYNTQKIVNKEVNKIIEYSGTFTGIRYKAGGNTPKGFDCSGFTQYIFKEFNYYLPRTTQEQSRAGRNVNRKEIRPGDLVFFTGKNKNSKTAGHVGIVVDANRKGNFLFIHASTGRGVTVSSDTESYYKTRYLHARRIVR